MTEKQFTDEIQGLGTDSPVLGAFLPQVNPEDFREALATYHASKETVELRPQPSTDEGRLAKRSIESVRDSAKERLDTLVAEVLSAAHVVQAGGSRAEGTTIKGKIEAGALRAADRMFPRFAVADNPAWAKVVERARGGNTMALEAVGHAGEANKQPVAKIIYETLTSTWTVGSTLLSKFSKAPYGWTKDPINGALFALLVSGDIRAQMSGKDVAASSIPPTGVSAASYIRESVSIGVQERIAARKTLGMAGITVAPGEEAANAALLVERLSARAAAVSGDSPLPFITIPDEISQLRTFHGNELLLGLSKSTDSVGGFVLLLDKLEAKSSERRGKWELAKRLSRHALLLADVPPAIGQMEAVRTNRSLLEDQDSVGPLVVELADRLRQELKTVYAEYVSALDSGLQGLAAEQAWRSLDEAASEKILRDNNLVRVPEPTCATPANIADSLDATPVTTWIDRTAALVGRLVKARTDAVHLTLPQAKKVAVPPATLSTSEEVDAYLTQLRQHLLSELTANTSIVI